MKTKTIIRISNDTNTGLYFFGVYVLNDKGEQVSMYTALITEIQYRDLKGNKLEKLNENSGIICIDF